MIDRLKACYIKLTELKGGNMYSPKKFAEMIGKSVKTLQRWIVKGFL